MRFVLLSPWFVETLRSFVRAWDAWRRAQQASDLIANVSFLLIVGGLLMLSVVVGMILLRSLLPLGTPVAAGERENTGRPMRRTPSLSVAAEVALAPKVASRVTVEAVRRGQQMAERTRATTLDEVLEGASGLGLGEARLTRVMDRRLWIRHYDCPPCRRSETRDEGCGRAVGYYEAALTPLLGATAKAREFLCHRRGDPACEFEVTF